MSKAKQIKAVKDIMVKYLSHWDMHSIERLSLSIEYVEEFGGLDMISFVDYCINTGIEDIIAPTVAHDINGMRDNCFLPKTSGYYRLIK